MRAEHRSIAQAILDAIKAVLKKLRIMLADGESFTPKQNAGLLSQLDILKECEKIWTDGLARASENRYAVGAELASVSEDSRKYSFVGRDADGIEIYETSNEVKNLTWADRKKRAVNLIENEYSGRTVRLIRNAEKIYAKFDEVDVNKNIYGDDKSSQRGKDAKVNVAADGTIYELVEHSRYNGNEVEKGKTTKAHKDVSDWDYFVKEVAIDGVYYDETINVRKTADGEYVYAIYLWENAKKKGMVPHIAQNIYKDKRRALTSEATMPFDGSVTSADGKRNKKLSLTDSDGRELSEQQAEYFKDSKVRDEDGNLLVMYHGTPKGDFTVFKDGSYFTQNRQYADGYQNETTGRTELNPKTYEVYLNITKPFDIRNDEKARDIYINDYIKGGNAVGINPYLSDAEYAEIESIDWTEGDDLKEFLIDEEYDYDGLILDEGADGGYGEEVAYRGDSYVIFSSEQVKSVDNLKPTADSDIRFSLKEPVEQTKDLIAVHNIGEDELLKTIKLGGFPMPSIAVTKAEMGHTMYGAVSVLFSKDTIDPEASRYNKVYSGDAYTPEFPHVDYEVDSKKGEQLQKYIENIIGDDLKDSSIGPYLDSNNLEDKINRQSGDFVEAYMNNEAMMYAFMKEREGDVELPQREVSFSHGGKYTNEQVKKFAEIFPENELNDIYAPGGPGIFEYYERNPEKIEQVREARNRDFRETHKSFAERFAEKNGAEFEYYKEVDFADFDNLLLSLLRYYEEGDTSKLDTAALGETVRAYTAEHNDEYLKWLAAISDGVVAGSGIRNEKDEFTSGARKRSFKALHDDVNLENVVKAMRRDAQTGSGIGGYSFMGSVTREYGSVDDIKSDTDRLRLEDMKTYNEYIDDIKSSVAEIAERLSEANPYIRVHDIESCIAEAVAKRKTKSGMKNFLEKELDIPADVDMGAVVTEILKLKERAQKLPTGYFEAKPQRVIDFDEVKAVIAPDSISEELKTAIEDADMELYEYEAGDDEDRIAEVNEAAAVKNVRFSVKDSFEEQVEGALSGKLDRNNHVYVCETPQILKDIGLDDLPMLMTQKHIRDINQKEIGTKKHNHGINKEIIKKIPQYLQSPAAIMDSLSTATQPGVVVLTEEVDSKSRPIIIVIRPNGQGFYNVRMRSNFILSMYGRNNFALFWDKNIQEKTFLYIDSKKSKALSEEVQLQLLQSMEGFALDTIIRKSKNVVNEKTGKRYSLSDEPAEERIKALEKRIDELREDIKLFRDKGWYLIGSGDLQAKPEDFVGQKVYSRTTGEERIVDRNFIEMVKDVQKKSKEADRLVDKIIELEEQTSAEEENSLPESNPVSEDAVIDYMAEHETEFSFISGPKDYEIKQRQVRIQTREELEAQVEKLRAEMKITKGQVLDEKSVRGDINEMVKMLMTHAESYTPDGRKKKTDRNLAAEGVNAAQQIFNALKRGQELDAITKAETGAVEIVENLNLVGDLDYYEYKGLRDYLRKTKIRISEEDANNIADFKAFKKANAGKLRITTNEGEGISVDSVYESLEADRKSAQTAESACKGI